MWGCTNHHHWPLSSLALALALSRALYAPCTLLTSPPSPPPPPTTVAKVTEALKLDRKDVDGRPMFVSKCVDKRANPDAVGHTFQHKYVLFARHVSCCYELSECVILIARTLIRGAPILAHVLVSIHTILHSRSCFPLCFSEVPCRCVHEKCNVSIVVFPVSPIVQEIILPSLHPSSHAI